ncbi:hypothetical protein [Curtobacterium sp. MCSS17_016]|uniref:hypothetical protein n=1 Tax=Curtobacterium sp. MCSS17_016 TaxID=2175644 RepID=UPI0011B71B3D|nr:hypothetical protein [Curtobacterium sp. MCSS17_016]WIE81227.1 hypothetical protein DEJ19_018510 [Curtobacterium sp. MCSS17_016]
MTISNSAENARENARHGDGKFGEQHRDEAAVTLQQPKPSLSAGELSNLDLFYKKVVAAAKRTDEDGHREFVAQLRTFEGSLAATLFEVAKGDATRVVKDRFPDAEELELEEIQQPGENLRYRAKNIRDRDGLRLWSREKVEALTDDGEYDFIEDLDDACHDLNRLGELTLPKGNVGVIRPGVKLF